MGFHVDGLGVVVIAVTSRILQSGTSVPNIVAAIVVQ